MATDDKYDRQIRLWGGHGQKLLSTSKVLLLGANPSGTETLKNLILPAVGQFTIVDDALVQERDCGNNFFVTHDSIGKSKAQVVTENLVELNPDVKGDYFNQEIHEFIENPANQELIKSYQLIIATDIDNVKFKFFRIFQGLEIKLSNLAELNNQALIVIKQYGLIGSSYAVQFKFGDLDDMEHAHIPYSIVLIHILEKWKTAHDGQIPKTEAEKEEFRQIIKHTSRNFSKELNFIEAFDNAFKCFKQPEIRYTLEEIFEDPKIQDKNETSSFWILCAALQRYYTTHGLLPLSGKLPDMTSTTDFYLALQRIYQEKALEDMEEFIVNLQQIMTERGVAHESISLEDIKLFCQNSQILEVTRFRSPKEEIENPDYSDFVNEMYDNESVAPWYVCMRAVEQFRMRNGRYPGLHDSQLDQDFQSVRQEVSGIMSQIMSDGSLRIEDKYIKEIVRYSDSKIHTVAAFLGGVASQEAIKLLIQQYTPFNHTFVYDGIHHRCQTFSI
eukprot:403342543